MNNLKKKIINEIIRIEGGYCNDPDDSGGETNYGITVSVAREFGYTGSMCDMPKRIAFDIYKKKYWDKVKADEIAELSSMIVEEVVDTGINMGTSRAIKFLQRALNALNNRESLYNDLIIDGGIGPATLAALKGYLSVRDEATLSKALNCLQGAYYIELVERREKDEKFLYGWIKNRVEL